MMPLTSVSTIRIYICVHHNDKRGIVDAWWEKRCGLYKSLWCIDQVLFFR